MFSKLKKNFVILGNILGIFLPFDMVWSQQCVSGRLRVKEDRKDTRLVGFAFVTFNNEGPNSCLDKCIYRPECHSFNYNLDLRVCEINMRVQHSSPELHFQTAHGYAYVEVDQYRGEPLYERCRSNPPCIKGEVCSILSDGSNICIADKHRQSCPDGWDFYGGHCYLIVVKTGNWYSAKQGCENVESFLIKIDTDGENKWTKDLIKEKTGSFPKLWIGLNDIEVEGEWKWESETPTVDFLDWLIGEPSNGSNNEYCAFLKFNGVYGWNDTPCRSTSVIGYICEKLALNA